MKDIITWTDVMRAAKMLGADELETVGRRHRGEAIYCTFACYGCACVALWVKCNNEVPA